MRCELWAMCCNWWAWWTESWRRELISQRVKKYWLAMHLSQHPFSSFLQNALQNKSLKIYLVSHPKASWKRRARQAPERIIAEVHVDRRPRHPLLSSRARNRSPSPRGLFYLHNTTQHNTTQPSSTTWFLVHVVCWRNIRYHLATSILFSSFGFFYVLILVLVLVLGWGICVGWLESEGVSEFALARKEEMLEKMGENRWGIVV